MHLELISREQIRTQKNVETQSKIQRRQIWENVKGKRKSIQYSKDLI